MAWSSMKYILLLALFAGTTGPLRGQAAPDTLKTATLQVTGITCQGDMPVIKKKLINQEGIDEVTFTEAKGGSSMFTVFYHTSVTSEQQLVAIIESSPSCDYPDAFPYAAKPAKAKKKRD